MSSSEFKQKVASIALEAIYGEEFDRSMIEYCDGDTIYRGLLYKLEELLRHVKITNDELSFFKRIAYVKLFELTNDENKIVSKQASLWYFSQMDEEKYGGGINPIKQYLEEFKQYGVLTHTGIDFLKWMEMAPIYQNFIKSVCLDLNVKEQDRLDKDEKNLERILQGSNE